MIRIGSGTLVLSASAPAFVASSCAAHLVPGEGLSSLVRWAVLIAVLLGLVLPAYWLLERRGRLIDWEQARFGGWRAIAGFVGVLAWCAIVAVLNVRVPIGDPSVEVAAMVGEFVGLVVVTAVVENWVAASQRQPPVAAPPN